jgi:hypothetical protein
MVRAYTLFDLAATAGYPGAANNRDMSAKQMTAAELAEARKPASGAQPDKRHR